MAENGKLDSADEGVKLGGETPFPQMSPSADEFLRIVVEDPMFNFAFGLGKLVHQETPEEEGEGKVSNHQESMTMSGENNGSEDLQKKLTKLYEKIAEHNAKLAGEESRDEVEYGRDENAADGGNYADYGNENQEEEGHENDCYNDNGNDDGDAEDLWSDDDNEDYEGYFGDIEENGEEVENFEDDDNIRNFMNEVNDDDDNNNEDVILWNDDVEFDDFQQNFEDPQQEFNGNMDYPDGEEENWDKDDELLHPNAHPGRHFSYARTSSVPDWDGHYATDSHSENNSNSAYNADDFYNENDFDVVQVDDDGENWDEGSVANNVQYYNGMTIEEMARMMSISSNDISQ